jgi:general stress protein 26
MSFSHDGTSGQNSNDVEKVWDLSEKIGFCMLATSHGNSIRSRPMSASIRRDERAFYFLTDVNNHKDDEIARDPNVNLAFADSKAMKFVSISGKASVSDDRAKIKELWSTPAKAWWDSEDDPSIRVLKIVPDTAEYWDSPGKLVSMIKMAAAAVSDSKPDLGDNAKVSL